MWRTVHEVWLCREWVLRGDSQVLRIGSRCFMFSVPGRRAIPLPLEPWRERTFCRPCPAASWSRRVTGSRSWERQTRRTSPCEAPGPAATSVRGKRGCGRCGARPPLRTRAPASGCARRARPGRACTIPAASARRRGWQRRGGGGTGGETGSPNHAAAYGEHCGADVVARARDLLLGCFLFVGDHATLPE